MEQYLRVQSDVGKSTSSGSGFGCTHRAVQENMVCLKSCPKILAWVKKRTVLRKTDQCLISEWRKNGKGKINKGMEIKAYRLGWNEFGGGK